MEPVPRSTGSVVDRLAAAGCVAADEEAHDLVTAAPDPATLEAWIVRRERGEPLEWITGAMRFCGHRLAVDPGVYVPRRQSEELAHRAAALLATCGGRAVDLCTGAGPIAVHLKAAAPNAPVVGVDVDERAAACAKRNGVNVVVGDLAESLQPGGFDLVTAVAPYVPTPELGFLPADVQRYEPRLALDGGSDGLDVVRRVVAAAARLLRIDGWLVLEVGGAQDEHLRPTLAEAGFRPATPWWDEHGDLRGVGAQFARRDPRTPRAAHVTEPTAFLRRDRATPASGS